MNMMRIATLVNKLKGPNGIKLQIVEEYQHRFECVHTAEWSSLANFKENNMNFI